MSLPVVVRSEAEADVQSARLWYDQRRPGLGTRFMAQVAEAIDRVEQTPEAYGEVAVGISATLVPRHPHDVYYRIKVDHVEVLAVLHGGRNPSEWQDRF